MTHNTNTYGDANVADQAVAIFGNVYGNIILEVSKTQTQGLSGILVDGVLLYPKFQRRNHVRSTHTIETLIIRNDIAGRNYNAAEIELEWHKREDLGSGVFGVVHREECHTGTLVKNRAVKIMRLRQLHDSKVDYKKEISALSRLSNPAYAKHFVELYDWYIQDVYLYLAMEYIMGGDLAKYVVGGLPESDAKQIASQLLEGIRIMHSLDIVHRDIKPANILVVRQRPDWWVKIGVRILSHNIQLCAPTQVQWHIKHLKYSVLHSPKSLFNTTRNAIFGPLAVPSTSYLLVSLRLLSNS